MTRRKIAVLISFVMALSLMACNGNTEEFPEQGSRNDYDYTFTITSTKGEVGIRYTVKTDGEGIYLNGQKKTDERMATFEVGLREGESKQYTLSTKKTQQYSVEVSVLSPNVKGKWLFEERRNGKVVRKKEQSFKVGTALETYKVTYTSSTK